ncbi:MAG: NAD-dependent epimerase/dehydratase family protein [Bacteroidota bacterium]|nr:NAD-dependent epimerase/dehydratase family protein [Bacteroidota bacterium]
MSNSSRNILVTGGAGFIGSHICDALLELGHEVHVIDDLSGGYEEQVPDGVMLHVMDIRSDGVADLWQTYRFDTMIHLAAQMDVRRSVSDPRFDADINIGGLLNLMEAGRQNGLEKVVFSSTGGAIYGEPVVAPQPEEHPLQPLSPYGITKLCSEKYLFFYEHVHGISFVALRYGNVYGPRQNPHGEAGVVAIFCERMLDGKQPIVNGDGLQTRDYVHVKDVVRANMSAIEYHESGIFNVGTAVETDVVTLFEVLRDELAPDMPVEHGPGKAGEQMRSVLSYAHSKATLGWEPTVDVRQGLTETARWFRDRQASK